MFKLFPREWQTLLAQKNYADFTDIQQEVFTPIIEGKSTLGISPTGTGKTLAYLWPILLKIKAKKAQQVLILAPNTELAGQIFEVTKEWGQLLGLNAQLLLSGSSQKRQIERLKKGPEIVIGTPGRIFELVKLKKIKLMKVDTIVLDEFDELMKDSQAEFVKRISHYVPKNHQFIYMSATANLDLDIVDKNTHVFDLSDQKLDNIQHYYLMVEKRHKFDLLRKLMNVTDFRALAFFNTLSDLGASEEKLQYHGYQAVSIASDVNVKFRKVIVEKFKHGEIQVILATDLMARGIDIEDLEYVVNVDLPSSAESYTHRSGRCGRMGRKGVVITFISHPEELKKLKKYADVRELTLKNKELSLKS